MQLRGFVNIIKPEDMTSSDAVVIVRGALSRAAGERQKVGHLGTLDPLATGVLPIAVGKATRLFDFMQQKKKRYVATFTFGSSTPTLDRGSEICVTAPFSADEAQIESAASAFCGEILQVPPDFSAKSVGGKRAYDLAREGKSVRLEAKKVVIYSFKRIDGAQAANIFGAPLCDNEYAFDIECGSGTYIRSLARDLAASLGTVGYMTRLKRISSGSFDIQSGVDIETFKQTPLEHILPIDVALADLLAIDLNDEEARRASNGLSVKTDAPDADVVKVTTGGDIIALGRCKDGALALTVRL